MTSKQLTRRIRRLQGEVFKTPCNGQLKPLNGLSDRLIGDLRPFSFLANTTPKPLLWTAWIPLHRPSPLRSHLRPACKTIFCLLEQIRAHGIQLTQSIVKAIANTEPLPDREAKAQYF